MTAVSLPASTASFGDDWFERLAAIAAPAEPASGAKLERVRAKVTHEARLVKAVKAAKAVVSGKPKAEPVTLAAAARLAAPERFLGAVTPADEAAPIILAYADPSPTAAGSALDALAAGEDIGTLATDGPLAQSESGLPEDVPLPDSRPKKAEAKPDDVEQEKAETTKKAADDAVKAEVEKPEPAKPAPDKDKTVAMVKPDKPETEDGESGGFLKKLFGGGSSGGSHARAGNGVAVYDISAATVYMPDGTTLEAHSGIGKMADNPKYVDVKMRGPTPPHTYVLKMRETLFHGVQAIRMLPVDGKNLHGRDGFLTHSYLLRGRRAESHGCVAFKDYPRFLAAFKAGKVKKLVVVSGGGKNIVRMAKNGQRA